MSAKRRTRRNVTALVTVLALILAPGLSLPRAEAQQEGNLYCSIQSSTSTNDTSSCKKNANGGAGCTGTITVNQGVSSCVSSYWNYNCTMTVRNQKTTYEVTPSSSTAQYLVCLAGVVALTPAMVVCIIAALAAAGLTGPLAPEVAAGLIVACVGAGGVAAAALIDPCCYTYCVKTGNGDPSGGTVSGCQ